MRPSFDYTDLEFLVRELDRTPTAILAGARNRSTVEEWLSGRLIPTDKQIERLNFASNLFREMSKFQGENNTKHWFKNADLAVVGKKRMSPIEAIGEELFDEVRTLAVRMMR